MSPSPQITSILSPLESEREIAKIEPKLLSRGSTGVVFELNGYIVVKKVRPGKHDDFANEQAIFDILEDNPPSPYIIQRLYRTEDAIFLRYAINGDLASLIRKEQHRDESTQRVTSVEFEQPWELCSYWIKQLCSAVGWLHGLGLAHCDIRPGNVLLSAAGHVKLADFAHAHRIGEDMPSGREPFARLLGDEGGPDRGTYGKTSHQTDMFAIGSVFYSLTRGYDPFEDQWYGDYGPDHSSILAQKLQRMEFPLVGRLECDEIIRNCWHGQYKSITHLATHLDEVDRDHWGGAFEDDPDWVERRIQEAKTVAQDGTLEQFITH